MSRTVVDDCWGGRWTVRARHERHAAIESDNARRLREPALRALLEPALAPHPGSGPALASSEQDTARLSESAMGWGRMDLADSGVAFGMRASLRGGPLATISAIWHGIQLLREPAASF